MKDTELIVKLNQAITSAKASLEAVERWSEMLSEQNGVDSDVIKEKAKNLPELEDFANEDVKVVEGIFDGENMVAKKGDVYPVPSNYASKSKLIEGDKLKLTIQPNGAFVYKQIELIPRKLVTGKLIMDGSQYKVLCDDKTYAVLYASVTFFRAKVGDGIAVTIPEDGESNWAAIENVIPVKSTAKVA
ncbi:hypothetical protein K9M41_01625 [Candidatus Gracilibacteria bacterium]|nr:hypothetical protein [Candidatus Gracilibacteria bacterium]